MAARPMASATISFGLVSIPCKLFPTVDNTSAVRFNYLSKDGSRLRQQYIRASDGEIVEREDRVQGYEFAKGQYVTFTADELKALNVVATNAIDIDEFIPLADVERLYIERVYYLGPDKGAGRSYHLLRAALGACIDAVEQIPILRCVEGSHAPGTEPAGEQDRCQRVVVHVPDLLPASASANGNTAPAPVLPFRSQRPRRWPGSPEDASTAHDARARRVAVSVVVAGTGSAVELDDLLVPIVDEVTHLIPEALVAAGHEVIEGGALLLHPGEVAQVEDPAPLRVRADQVAQLSACAVDQAPPEGLCRGHVVVAAPVVAPDVGLPFGVVELGAVGGHRNDHVIAAHVVGLGDRDGG